MFRELLIVNLANLWARSPTFVVSMIMFIQVHTKILLTWTGTMHIATLLSVATSHAVPLLQLPYPFRYLNERCSRKLFQISERTFWVSKFAMQINVCMLEISNDSDYSQFFGYHISNIISDIWKGVRICYDALLYALFICYICILFVDKCFKFWIWTSVVLNCHI